MAIISMVGKEDIPYDHRLDGVFQQAIEATGVPDKSKLITNEPYTFGTIFKGFSGCDVKAYLNDKPYGLMQSISVRYVPESDQYEGTMIVLLTDKGIRQVVREINDKILYVVGANEYGNSAVLIEPCHLLVTEATTGMGVDDIVIEATINFVAEHVEGWEPKYNVKVDAPDLKTNSSCVCGYDCIPPINCNTYLG